MALEKIASFQINNVEKRIKIFVNNNPNPFIPELDPIEFIVFKGLLETLTNDKINKMYEPNEVKILFGGIVIGDYVKGFNINYQPKHLTQIFNISLNDINTQPNNLTLPNNYLVFLSFVETISFMKLK